MFGSIWIIGEILSDHERRKLPYHRIMLGLSFFDMCSSALYFAAPWIRDPGDEGAACVAVGVTVWTAALCIPLYNAALAIYFNLSIRYGWREDRIAKDFERYIHPSIILFGLAFTVPAIPWNLYNPRFNVCYPLESEENFMLANIYLFVYAAGILFSTICVTTLMLKVYFYVNKILRHSRQVSSRGNVERDTQINTHHPAKLIVRTFSSLEDWLPKVRTVALLYTLPFYFTWVIPLIWNTVIALSSDDVISWIPSVKTIYIMQIYTASSLPLQGFLNWMIYINLYGVTGKFLLGIWRHSSGVEIKSNSSPQIPNRQEEQLQDLGPITPQMAEPSSSKEDTSKSKSSKDITMVEGVDERINTGDSRADGIEAGEPCFEACEAIKQQVCEADEELGRIQLAAASTGEVDQLVMVTTISEDGGDNGIEAMGSGVAPIPSSNETRETVDRTNRQEGEDSNTALPNLLPEQSRASAVQEALVNALDVVRESSEIQSIESGGGDTVSFDSERLRIIGIVTEALELTRSFVEESDEDGSNSSPWPPIMQNETRPAPDVIPRLNVHSILSNYASSMGNGCQAPLPFVTSQAPLFPPSDIIPPGPSDLRQIIDETLEILNSEVESISSNSRTSDPISVRSRASELEAMLEGTLNAVNNFLSPQQSPSPHQQQNSAILRTARANINDVPTILDSIQRTEVSMLSSTIVAEEDECQEEGGNGEEGDSETRGS